MQNLTLVIVLEVGLVSLCFGQSTPTHLNYIFRLGTDTVAFESYTRDLKRIRVHLEWKKNTMMSGEFTVMSGSVPLQDFNLAMYEQLIMQARAIGKDSVPFNLFTNGPLKSFIKKVENNRYKSTYFFVSTPVFLTRMTLAMSYSMMRGQQR